MKSHIENLIDAKVLLGKLPSYGQLDSDRLKLIKDSINVAINALKYTEAQKGTQTTLL